jgi:hypothetical protein
MGVLLDGTIWDEVLEDWLCGVTLRNSVVLDGVPRPLLHKRDRRHVNKMQSLAIDKSTVLVNY